MKNEIAFGQKANLAGCFWMVAAMAGFAVEDALVKGAGKSLPVGQVLILLGLGGSLLFAAIAASRKERLFPPEVLSRAMLVRFVFEICGRLFYTLSIILTPLSTTTAILQTTPIVVVASAALLFKERVGPRRWTAILIGLAGVLIVIRPGTEGFSVLSILAVLGMLGFAGRDLASRAAPRSLGTSILGFYGFLAMTVAGVFVTVWQNAPFATVTPPAALFLSGAVLAGIAAYACLMKAMRTGEVAAVTPFRYTRLLFGVAAGTLLFGEAVTPSTAAGSCLILLSGLFILWRGRQVDRSARHAA